MLSEELRAQGWIEHSGGPCPVTIGSTNQIMLRDGRIIIETARRWGWSHLNSTLPETDIIAYKPETPDA